VRVLLPGINSRHACSEVGSGVLQVVVKSYSWAKFDYNSQECSIKSSTPLQKAWMGFDPYLYSSGSSSARPALVENSNYKVLYTQQGHCD